MREASRLGEKVWRGIPVSAGVCRGKVLVLSRHPQDVPQRTLADHEIPRDIERLEHALTETRRQILETQRQVNAAMGAEQANIFEAHLLVLEDQTLIEEVIRQVNQGRTNVEFALHQVTERYFKTLSQIEDEYLRERANDMRDVAERILNNLLDRQPGSAVLSRLTEPCILVSDDLAPSTTALLDRSKVLGFATDTGSKTSHTAILARSLGLPAVVGLEAASRQLATGDYVLLDGFGGLLIRNPTDQTLFEYGQLERRHFQVQERLRDLHDELAITLDGHHVILSANVEQASDAELVKASGAEGVGLFRTEFLFIQRSTMPTEEEQYTAYRNVAEALKPQPVVIRTLDLGGDKFLSQLQHPTEINPFLGWRAIRFCLQQTEMFRRQIRAILRASASGNVKLMFPLISGLDELLQARELVSACQQDLTREGVPFDPRLEIGVMIEVPSAVLIAESLAQRVDFFSIGTNDLIQYSLAVDRLNEKIAHLYEPTHPAIIRLIKLTVDAARQRRIWTGVCGEMAGDPVLVPLLLGLGVDELSTAIPLVPQIKSLIRRLKRSETQALADFALHCESAAIILDRCQACVRQAAPSLFESLSEETSTP